MERKNSRWFKYSGKGSPQGGLQLFCFPHAGGSARLYKDWAQIAEPEINVFPIQLPMRENRYSEKLPDRIEAVVDEFLQENQELFQENYAVFGHSLGAIFALELVYALQQRKARPCTCLFVSGTSYPKDKKVTAPFDEEEIREKLYLLGDADRELYSSELFMQYYLPVISKDLSLFSNYEWKYGEEKLKCPLYLFGAKQDDSISIGKMRTWENSSSDYLGETFFDGGHFYLTDHQQEMLQIIKTVCRGCK
ncbi:thioesterase II family protein [Clostridium aminobutyricum]|uniref:Thioesterase n=1 Tax=Clostridium aminobutyricum TaxID=33953 RepID=A0A939DA53_CLOAM|nr:thioesterase domain-containing protein [Clostridium aminobutyricum]MBN7773940.1 thioesterase [Clostridium aminobutyricum]